MAARRSSLLILIALTSLPTRPVQAEPPPTTPLSLEGDINYTVRVIERDPRLWLNVTFTYNEVLMTWFAEKATDEHIELTATREENETMMLGDKVAFALCRLMSPELAPRRQQMRIEVFVRIKDADIRTELKDLLRSRHQSLRSVAVSATLPFRNADNPSIDVSELDDTIPLTGIFNDEPVLAEA